MKETNSKSQEKQHTDGAEGRVETMGAMNDVDKRHALVVSLFSMLQAPSASIVVPPFGDRNS